MGGNRYTNTDQLWIQFQLVLLFSGICDSSRNGEASRASFSELKPSTNSPKDPFYQMNIKIPDVQDGPKAYALQETKPLFVSDNGTFPFPVFPPGLAQGMMPPEFSPEQKGTGHAHSAPRGSVVFISPNNTVVNTHTGSTVTLPCVIHKETKFGMITWARQLLGVNTSYQILTIGDSTYIDDPRFLVDMSTVNYDWSIKILRVEPFDSGTYKCQVNTHPPQYIATFLNIADAYAELAGPGEKFIKTGSELLLNCSFQNITGKPDYIFWYHDAKMINHRGKNRGQHVDFASARHSTLYIPNVQKSDSGNYTCAPHNLRPASVYIHIIDDDSNSAAAAIHRTDGTTDQVKKDSHYETSSAASTSAFYFLQTPMLMVLHFKCYVIKTENFN